MKKESFFSRLFQRRNKRKLPKKSKTIFRQKSRFANERMAKVIRKRIVQISQILFIGIFVLIVSIIIITILAGSALSLKTGAQNPVLGFVVSILEKTPLAPYFQSGPTEEKFDIVGISGIPEYPGSEFVFANSVTREKGGFKLTTEGYSEIEKQELYKFLSSKQSVYYIPINSSWKDVVTFYKKELVKYGWSISLTAPVDDLDKIPGEYFVKENLGLHLYSISHDIWYEVISKEQAESGLRDRVAAYKAKQYLVESASGGELPQETWWSLRYTNDWEFTMIKHPIFGEQQVYFRQKQTNETLTIAIINRYRQNPADVEYSFLEQMGQDHLRTWLASQPPTVSFTDFTQRKSVIAGQKVVEFSSEKNNIIFTFLVNEKSKILYVIEFKGKTNKKFYEYLTFNLLTVKK